MTSKMTEPSGSIAVIIAEKGVPDNQMDSISKPITQTDGTAQRDELENETLIKDGSGTPLGCKSPYTEIIADNVKLSVNLATENITESIDSVNSESKLNHTDLCEEVNKITESPTKNKEVELVQNADKTVTSTVERNNKATSENCIKTLIEAQELGGCGTAKEHNDKTESKEVFPKRNNDSTVPMNVIESAQEPDHDQVKGLKNKDLPGCSKDEYRQTIDISDSEDTDSDSDSSSVMSVSSPTKSDSGSDIESCSVVGKKKSSSFPVIKAKGELLPEDLPPLEQLHISVPSSLCAEVGVVTSIVNTLVVIQSHKGVPALDLDSVLFLDWGSRSLGLVFDVFGPVAEPLYCVRFNSPADIADYNVKPGDKVYFAPDTEHSKYVFLQQLMKMKGSDASTRYDIEPPVQIDYSDDEEERKARKKVSGSEVKEEEDDQAKRKRDQIESFENKKKFATQQNQRSQRGGFNRSGQCPSRPPYRQNQPQNQNHTPRLPRGQGPIHPPTFNFPPPPISGPSMAPQNPQVSQSNFSGYPAIPQAYNNQMYQNPMQQGASFGQLPYVPAQSQVDPRMVQFGTQFAQMVCNLQAASSGGPVNLPPPGPPTFSAPYNHPMYHGNQNCYDHFFKGTPQGPPPTYTAPPFNSVPPVALPSNLPPTNIPPPSGVPIGQPPPPPPPPITHQNQNAAFGGPFQSTYSSYPNRN